MVAGYVLPRCSGGVSMGQLIFRANFLYVFLLCTNARAQFIETSPPDELSKETWGVCEEWLSACRAEFEGGHRESLCDGPTLKRLLERPDVDLCLLKVIDDAEIARTTA